MRALVSLCLVLSACVGEAEVFRAQDGGVEDGGVEDLGPSDFGPTDFGVDAGPDDLGPVDTGPAFLTEVDKIVARRLNTVVLRGGALFASGNNESGQLGRTDLGDTELFIQVGTDTDWVDVTGGSDYFCGQKQDRKLYCWGQNDKGQLGNGSFTSTSTPTAVNLPEVKFFRAQYNHVCAILEADDSLWCWGGNFERQLGSFTNFNDQPTPIQVGSETDWLWVGPGQGHTCGIRSPGTLWCWGRNTQSQSGQDPAVNEQLSPTQVDGRTDWAEVWGGQGYTCALAQSRKMYCWGLNNHRQMGVDGLNVTFTPTAVGLTQDWLAFGVDTFATCGLRADQTVECWGRSSEGQIGLPGPEDVRVPTLVQTGSVSQPIGLSVGRFHACIYNAAGQAACTGSNFDGRLGVGDFDQRNEFTQGILRR